MSRKGDNAPIGHTCPKIDDVISMVHNWYSDAEEITKSDYQIFEKKMEEIRSANSTLREWGNEQCLLAEQWEDDLNSANNQISDLKDEIESLKDELKFLEKELASHE